VVTPGITVAIPAHPARVANGMLHRALASVWTQTLPAAAVSVAVDHDREGAWTTRQRTLDAVQTEYVAFLDSDDELMPHHLEVLAQAAQEGADYAFAWFTIRDAAGNEQPGWDPLGHFGKPWNPQDPHQTTITTLVRTELAKAVGFKSPPEQQLIHGQRLGEDFAFTLGCMNAGAEIVHVPVKSWWWSHHGANSSGTPGQGDAA
jgi:hypothetical protein